MDWRGCIRIDSPGCYWAEFGVADGTDPCRGLVPGASCDSPDDPYPPIGACEDPNQWQVWLFQV